MPNQIERVAIIGAGAMGGMYAAYFAQAGFEVGFVARDDRADRLRRQQFTVNGERLRVSIFDESAEPADLAIFAVKDRHLPAAIDAAAAVIGPQTIVISVMNGLDSERLIAERYGDAHVLLAIALGMDADRFDNDFRFRQSGRIVFGRSRNSETPDADVAAVQAALDRAGLVWQTPADMTHELWSKFLFNTGINQASAVLDQPYGAFQPDGDARNFMLALIDEVVAVGQAEGVDLGQATVDRWLGVLANMPAAGRTSMHQDAAAGRPTEVETFAGRVVALGQQHGIATPYNQAVLWILRSR